MLKRIVLLITAITALALTGCASQLTTGQFGEIPVIELPSPVVAIPTPTGIQITYLPMSSEEHIPLTDPNAKGIGVGRSEVTFRKAWLSYTFLSAVDSMPIYNGGNETVVFDLTYGIAEQIPEFQPAPEEFKGYVRFPKRVEVYPKCWVDVPVVITIPKDTVGLPDHFYFNIIAKDETENGSIRVQGAERWEITLQ